MAMRNEGVRTLMALKSSMSDEPDKKKMGRLVMLFQVVVLLWVGPQLSGRPIHLDCNLGPERSGAAQHSAAQRMAAAWVHCGMS